MNVLAGDRGRTDISVTMLLLVFLFCTVKGDEKDI